MGRKLLTKGFYFSELVCNRGMFIVKMERNQINLPGKRKLSKRREHEYAKLQQLLLALLMRKMVMHRSYVEVNTAFYQLPHISTALLHVT